MLCRCFIAAFSLLHRFVAASSLPHHCFFTGSSMLYRCFIAASLAFIAVSAPFKHRCFAASLPLCRCFVAANLKRQDGVRNTWQHLAGTRIRGHRGGPDGTSCFSGCNTKTARLGETLKLFFCFFPSDSSAHRRPNVVTTVKVQK